MIRHGNENTRQMRLARLWISLTLSVLAVDARAEDKQPLPAWKANAGQVTKLGEEYKDDRIRIRLPKGFAPLATNPPKSGEAGQQAGLVRYGWTPTGQVPSASSLLVYLLPPLTTSDETLDDFVEGFMESLTRQVQDISLGRSQAGTLHGVEARRGSLEGTIPNLGKVQILYLVFRDNKGTLAVTAMLPAEATGSPTAQMMAASLLTAARAK